MQHHKIGLIGLLIVMGLTAATAAMGADPIKVDWNLDSNGSEIKLGTSQYSFTGNGSKCKISAAKESTNEKGQTVTARYVSCNTETFPAARIACGKNQPESFVEYGDFRFSCTVK